MQTQEQLNQTAADQVANETKPDESNAPDFHTFGKQALTAWISGEKQNAKGDQLATLAVLVAWETTSFLAVVHDSKGKVERQFMFHVDELDTDIRNEKGRDNKAMTARSKAFFAEVFGIADPTTSQKNRIKDVVTVVRHITNMGYTFTDVRWDEKKSRLEVPLEVIQAEPAKDAEDEEKKSYEAMRTELVAISGKKGRTFAELLRRARPERKGSGASDNNKEDARPKAFISSLHLIQAVLKYQKDENAKVGEGEGAIALTPAMRRQLFALSTMINDYFAADPFDAEEQGEEDKKNGANKKLNTRASK